ncbi:MAG TPA: LPS export ABC transporter periplasmic protein LptC [Gemmatimonadetes bacterium]|nr:LPS export ABC transporter periplasmic protein LptC [Gemmatimonadota bacterium]HIN78465.1 LPS export ABC transporter periplasmic protein LptC [Gemmatimonadota bacterium]
MNLRMFLETWVTRRTYALVVVMCLGGCGEPATTTVASSDLQEIDADNVIFGMVSYITANGIRKGYIQADTAYLFMDSAKAELHQMRILFYNEDGSPRATVTGTSGEWDQTTDRMTAWGDVLLVVHSDQRRIETGELNYDPENERIWSDSSTVQTMADGTITRGSAFETDMEFRNVRIASIRGAIGR